MRGVFGFQQGYVILKILESCPLVRGIEGVILIQTISTYIPRKSRSGDRSYKKRNYWTENCESEAMPTEEKRENRNPRTER